jgi:TonB family protein
MISMTLSNFAAYLAQIAVLVIVCAGLPRVLGLRVPVVQYAFWRVVLLVCLLLPLVQAWKPVMAVDVITTQSATSVTTTLSSASAEPTAPSSIQRINPVAALMFIVLAGAVARLLWIAIGVARLHALRRASATQTAAGFEDLCASIGTDAPILWSSQVRHPVSFGLRRPVVLLPVALKAVDPATQRAVVAHELHHVKRRDWGWLLAEELLRAIFWFHPAMWWLISRVQLARETVVDELTILVTNARRTYLDALLAFADDAAFASSSAFSARRHLFHRVMLLSKEGDMSSVRVAAGSGLLIAALAAGGWTATKVFPLYTTVVAAQSQTPARDPLPKRGVQDAAAYHRQAVLLWEQARRASVSPQEQFELLSQGVVAENRALDLNPDYVEALTYKNILLRMLANLTADPVEGKQLLREADELRGRAIEIRKMHPYEPKPGEPLPPPPPPPPPPASAASDVMSPRFAEEVTVRRPLRIGGNVKAPAKVHNVRPVYPPLAQAARVQGVVIAEVLIDESGAVVDARVLRSIPLLDQAALDAVLQWRFAPTYVDGVPRNVLMTVTVSFQIE